MPLIDIINGIDRQLITALNTDGVASYDIFWALYTDKLTWIPLAIVVAWCLLRPGTWPHRLLIVLCAALLFFASDFIVSECIKHAVCRLRPSHDPAVMHLLRYVDDYRGGTYGFPSNHASNGFAAATFLALVMRCPAVTIATFLWAIGSCYSRLYLGVHYPSDIVCGALIGILIALLVYAIYRKAARRLLMPTDGALYATRQPYAIVAIFLLTVTTLLVISAGIL